MTSLKIFSKRGVSATMEKILGFFKNPYDAEHFARDSAEMLKIIDNEKMSQKQTKA